MERRELSEKEWRDEAVRRFGPNPMGWKFICPSCRHVAAVRDWSKAGAPEGAVGFSCVGRWDGHMDTPIGTKPGPCNYAGGGLIGLNPVTVISPDGSRIDMFEFVREGI